MRPWTEAEVGLVGAMRRCNMAEILALHPTRPDAEVRLAWWATLLRTDEEAAAHLNAGLAAKAAGHPLVNGRPAHEVERGLALSSERPRGLPRDLRW